MKRNPDYIKFLTKITRLPSHLKQDILLQQYLQQNKLQLHRAKSIPEIFLLLNVYWNYLNFELLEYIIQIYGENETSIAMECFTREVKVFQQETTLAMFYEASLRPRRKRLQSRELAELELTIRDGKLTPDSPLLFVQEFRQQFAVCLSLQEIIMQVLEQ